MDRSAPTRASPIWPTPGGSCLPRANTTSASGHAADADGISVVVDRDIGTESKSAASTTAAARLRTREIKGLDFINDLRAADAVRYVRLRLLDRGDDQLLGRRRPQSIRTSGEIPP